MAVSPGSRIPPGQHLVTTLPVLHAGSVMYVDKTDWKLSLSGLISPHASIDYGTLLAMPPVDEVRDIHCVTTWSIFDTHWRGVRVTDLLRDYTLDAKADHCVVHDTATMSSGGTSFLASTFFAVPMMPFHQSSGFCSAPPPGYRYRGTSTNSESRTSPSVDTRADFGPDVPRSIARMYFFLSPAIVISLLLIIS